ncbi:phosphatase PAP2 family protein [[Mycobacterium] kokjensenii]|uniref:Phosphatase PAP2 family protein n=1 Tax=[Mycobacterium] kokjensenii TaxID=3064287 RepID=A0ABN9MUK9_9MYCO|nr:phosphatase PAP2 family protein [Mycolicibacter sp. MU0083]CAJ1493301.1 phosphatase PAP2 family protein [Mycolicibacter sp. MU0083]
MRATSGRTPALISIAVAVAVYVTMLVGYRQGWGWLAGADTAALNAGYDIAVQHPVWVRFWDGISTVFEPAVFRLAGMVLIVVALLRRRPRAALFLLVSVELTSILTVLAKGSVGRPRPATALVAASSTSFPSGHALGVVIGVGALLAVVLPTLRANARRAALIVGALVVVAVGVARVALNVHHPSDVLAGWALGWAYLMAWVLALNPGEEGVHR